MAIKYRITGINGTTTIYTTKTNINVDKNMYLLDENNEMILDENNLPIQVEFI